MSPGRRSGSRLALGSAGTLALLLVLAPRAHAQSAPASLPAEPPFPPLPVAGEAPVPPLAPEPTGSLAEPTGQPPPRENGARLVQPPPLPPPATPGAPPAAPVPDDIRHARGIALVLLQLPTSALWGAAVAGSGLLAASAVLAAPGMGMWPLGGALALVPLATSLAGAGAAVLVNLGAAGLVDLLSGHPMPEGTAPRLALWSGLYAGLVAMVAGLPLTVPVALAASGLFTDAHISDVMTYALVASLVPLAVGPLAALEAANEAGYRADLPAWCWHALSICSLGTYVVF